MSISSLGAKVPEKFPVISPAVRIFPFPKSQFPVRFPSLIVLIPKLIDWTILRFWAVISSTVRSSIVRSVFLSMSLP
jgi:hypothetical protein